MQALCCPSGRCCLMSFPAATTAAAHTGTSPSRALCAPSSPAAVRSLLLCVNVTLIQSYAIVFFSLSLCLSSSSLSSFLSFFVKHHCREASIQPPDKRVSSTWSAHTGRSGGACMHGKWNLCGWRIWERKTTEKDGCCVQVSRSWACQYTEMMQSACATVSTHL